MSDTIKNRCPDRQTLMWDYDSPYPRLASTFVAAAPGSLSECLAFNKEDLMNKKQKQPEHMKDRRITIRLTETQYNIVERYAIEAGLTVSEYIRQMILHGAVPISYEIVVAMPEIRAMAKDLEGACNNLNQIARYFHIGGFRSKEIQADINSCIATIFQIRDSLARLEGDHLGDY